MSKPMILKHLTVFSVFAALAGTSYASTLGEQYISIDAGYIAQKRTDAERLGLRYNLPLIEQEQWGLDVGFFGRYETQEAQLYYTGSTGQRVMLFAGENEHRSLGLDLTAYLPVHERLKLFARAHAITTWADRFEFDLRAPYGEVETADYNYFTYGADLGLEFAFNDKFSLLGGAGIEKDDHRQEEAYQWFAGAHFWVTEVLGTQIGYRYYNYDGDRRNAHLCTLSLFFRY
ncbi:MAG: hypothetical protein Q7P63_02255 [Verrucomicrobiota bacterium JB022]|nr:hypothetical protein [Verrucomicrobiota bacterium JB022]